MTMTSFLTDAGYLALIVFAFVQACCIPISSEITFGFAGVLAHEGHLSLPLVIIIGAIAELAGSSAAYGLGRLGGRHTVERYRRYLLMTRRDVERVEQFFDRRGTWSIAVARVIPLVRAFAGLVAGFLEVPVLAFELFNLAGTLVWAAALSLIGYSLGSEWDRASRSFSRATDVLSAIVLLLLVGLIVHKWLQIRHERQADAAAAADGQGPRGWPGTGPPGQSPSEYEPGGRTPHRAEPTGQRARHRAPSRRRRG
ncbi:MAG: DedA family protein [Actinobacteria bacterium]|nr:DedA family protein [Actinomycetota bacterium]